MASSTDRSATPLRFYPALSSALGVRLWVKHDDEIHGAGGGNKVRKLRAILAEGEKYSYNALVTAGGASSNHVRAAALLAAAKGWRARILIHESEPELWPANLRLAQLASAEISFCDRAVVAEGMDTAMEGLRQAGLRPLYIWGGGHTPAGGCAYRDATIELADQCEAENVNPDFIVLASGTGTTQGGLQAGAAAALPQTNVIGISVAHEQATGVQRVQESLRMINAEEVGQVEFYDSFLAGGYGRSNSEQAETIRWAAGTEGLLLDPIYTGKAFHGLRSLINAGRIGLGSTVVFWHTGGIMNLVASDLC